MQVRVAILIVLIAIPATAFGHTEMFFPKVFVTGELPNTGFVFLNPEPNIATVYFYLIDTRGSTVSSTSMTIAPGGQVAKLGSELFPNPSSGGWVYVITDTESAHAFWLTYDAGVTFLDGAEAAQYDTIGPDQIIPLVAGQAEVSVINPNFLTLKVTLRLFGENGELAAPLNKDIPMAGGFQEQVSTMFPAADMNQARYIRIRTAGAPVASTVLIKGFLVPREAAVINGVNVTTRTELDFPHVITGVRTEASYTTVIGVTNLSGLSQTVTIIFNPDGGSPVAVLRTIPGNGGLRETAKDLFNLSSEFQSGWVRVSGTAAITGFAAYADSVAGGLAVVPPAATQTDFFFSHIADGPPQWQTGVALLNVSTTAATVDVYAVNPTGSLIGSARLILGAGQKIANVIHELIPETRGVNGGFLYIKSTNDLPLYGMELFYTEDLKVLSNVAAGRLPAGVKYTPPPSPLRFEP